MSAMSYTVCIYGHPILRQKGAPIARVDQTIRALADDMLKIMTERKGIGLAAQQIGQALQICVINFDPQHDRAEPGGPRLNPEVILPLVLINPVITSRTGLQRDTEGCLSVPEIWAPVQRALAVTVSFIDAQGHTRQLHAQGLLARAIQHELDHLNGILFIDRISPVKKISLAGQLKRMKKKTEAALGIR